MSDALQLTVTDKSGNVITINGPLTGMNVTIVPPAVQPTPPTGEPAIAWAQTINMLLSKAWSCKHDLGTPGNASGTFSYPATAPDKTPNCALLAFTNVDKGGALFHANVLGDATMYNTF